MPYLVLRGAVMHVTTPKGKFVLHTSKHNMVLLDSETLQEGRPCHFQKDGYTMIVETGDVKPTVFACRNCGDVIEQDGLCEGCKKLPRLLEPGGNADRRVSERICISLDRFILVDRLQDYGDP